jgi:hypothetical protein
VRVASVLQCVVVCYIAECSSVLQCVAVCCSVLQCVAVCCRMLQCYKCVAEMHFARHLILLIVCRSLLMDESLFCMSLLMDESLFCMSLLMDESLFCKSLCAALDTLVVLLSAHRSNERERDK